MKKKFLDKIFSLLSFISLFINIFATPIMLQARDVFAVDNPSGNDFGIDFIAAEPSTYDHSTGGGEYDSRVIGGNVVESLNGSSFSVGEKVTFFDAIEVTGSFDTGAASLHVTNEFGNETVNNKPAGFDSLQGVIVNTIPPETGHVNLDGNEVVSNVSSSISGGNLVVEFDISGLDPADRVIVRIDVILYNDITSGGGNVQSRFAGATLPNCTGNCSVSGSQTITLQDADEIHPEGDITIKKVTVPASDTLTDFDFTGDLNSFTLIGNGSEQSFGTLDVGSFQVSESVPSGWQLTDITCEGDLDTGSVVDLGTNTIDIDLDDGETITCTFTNTKLPTITVNKVLDPAQDTGLFNLHIDETQHATDVGNGGSTGTQIVGIGNHIIWESAGTGTDLNNYESVIGGACDAQGGVTVAAGDNAVCTITNTKYGKIIVEKQTNPDQEIGEFEFTGEVSGLISDGGTLEKDVLPGEYFVSEIDPGSFWDLDSIICSDGNSTGSLQTKEATFNVEAGETVTCTFTNVKLPTLEVVKQLEPSDDPGLFDLLIDAVTQYTDASNGNTTGAQIMSIGQHSVSESAGTGTDLGDYSTTYSDNCPAGSITLSAGDEETCTITNTRKTGQIEFLKIVEGEADPLDWFFSILGLQGTWQSGNIAELNTGSYTVSETDMSGYTLTNTDGEICYDHDGISATLFVTENGGVCSFTNTRDTGSVTVNKQVDTNGDGSFESGNTTANVIGFEWDLDAESVGRSMGTNLGDVETGNHTVTENVGSLLGFTFAGWFDNADEGSCLDPDGETLPVNISVSKDIDTEITLCNARNTASITVKKNIDWDESGQIGDHANDKEGTTDWTWDITNGEQNIATGQSRTLGTDTYTISEDLQPNYHLVGWSCTNGSNGDTNSIEVRLGQEDVICTITNAPDTGEILGKKFEDINGDHIRTDGTTDPNLPDWTIRLDMVGSSEAPSCSGGTVNGQYCEDITNASGNYSFSGLVPGDYIVSEVNQTGWAQTRPDATYGGEGHWADGTYHLTIGLGETIDGRDFGNQGRGSITVNKNVDTDGDGQVDLFGTNRWFWTINGRGDFRTGHTQALPAGFYLVAEKQVEGYHVSGFTCEGDEAPISRGRESSPSESNRVEVRPEQDLVCTYTNTRDTGDISGYKWEDTDGNAKWGEEDGLYDWTIELYEDNDGEIGNFIKNTTTNFDGAYIFENLPLGTYWVCEVGQDGYQQTFPLDNECHQVVIGENGQVVDGNNFGNAPLTDLHGYKWEDINGNRERDCSFGDNLNGEAAFVLKVGPDCEPLLGGWTINLYKSGDGWEFVDSRVTESDGGHFGWYWFEDLLPGEYKICEVSQDNWNQTYPSGESDGCHLVNLPLGDSGQLPDSEFPFLVNAVSGPAYNFGNQANDPSLLIEKTNNITPAMGAGDTVTYTILVTNDGNRHLYGVDIVDAPPGGFVYILGSTTGATTTDPTIASGKMTWENIGDLAPEASLTIQYQMITDSDLVPGIYTNLAYAKGSLFGRELQTDVLGRITSLIEVQAGEIEEEYETSIVNSDVVIQEGIALSGGVRGQVLGASIELPAAGSDTRLLMILIAMVLTGFGLKSTSKKLRKEIQK